MATELMNRETLSGEALFILKNLKDNHRLGRSNKLADVKAALEPSVSLEFDNYFFFLRKFHYIAMDREAQLRLTDQGERIVDGGALDKFAGEVGEFFSAQLSSGEAGDAAPESAEPEPADAPAESAPPEEDGVLAAKSRRAVDDPLGLAPALGGSYRDNGIELRRELSRDLPPPPPPLALSAAQGVKGAELDGRYLKYDAIGAGPLGTTFKGKSNALGTEVCIKELKDIFGYFSFLQRSEVIKRLKRELCAQAAVRHPSVTAVLDQNLDVARPYFVMELCKGSLRERLDQAGGKGLGVPAAIRYFLQLTYGLKVAHAQGLTHHNIKPENVLFDGYGNAKLSDFGLARVVEVDASKGMPQVFVGTGGMVYMAPELMARAKEAGAAADVYGLGILLYEMLTGQIPGRRSPLPSELNSEVPSKLDPIFDRMTQDRRQARYPDLDAMLTDFYGAFSDGEYLEKGDLVLWSEPVKG